ncbi:MAG: succinate dehydrogenase [Anaerolineae bacterium]
MAERTLPQEAQSAPLSDQALWAWLIQATSGALLVLLAGLHMLAQHFTAKGLLRYEDVAAWLRQPPVFALETAFLAAVLVHALAGVRAILLDLGLGPVAARRATLALVALGGVAFLYAVALTWSIAR